MKYLIAIGPVVALAILYLAWSNMKIPSGLGVVSGHLAELSSRPNAVSSQTDQIDKRVDALPFKEDLAATREAVLASLAAYGGIRIIESGFDYIHAVSTTRLMKFHDDLEFYFDRAARVVHFRSASRVGYSDMGLNRMRYERLRELYR